MKTPLLIFVLSILACLHAQQQALQITDPSQLANKRVNVGRLPLCLPRSYTPDTQHSGMDATVVAVKSQRAPSIPENALQRLPQNLRDEVVDQQNAAVLTFQFVDGTKLDTCAPFGPKRLSEYLELATGETLEAPAVTDTAAARPPNGPPTPEPSGLLSPSETDAALHGEGKDHWVTIEDMGFMAAQGKQVPRISLFMPEAILWVQAEQARKQFLSYHPSDDDRERVLTVVARGFVGETIADGCVQITRVVLISDTSGGVVKEAVDSQPLTSTWANNFGATNQCQSLRARFTLTDVNAVKAAAADGEFFVAVFSGSNRTKTYKIKRKHQAKLGLN